MGRVSPLKGSSFRTLNSIVIIGITFLLAACSGGDDGNNGEDTNTALNQIILIVINEDSNLEGLLSDFVGEDAHRFSLIQKTQHGLVTLNQTGAFTYTPNKNFVGEDQFIYSIEGGSRAGSQITVSLRVLEVNDPPRAAESDLNLLEDSSIDGQLLASDVEDDPLTYIVVAQPEKGTLSALNANTGEFIYTSHPNATGEDRFTFIADDGELDSNIGVVSIHIGEENDAPLISNYTYDAQEDVAITLETPATDPDGDNLLYSIETQPTHGNVLHLDDIPNNPVFVYKGEQNFFGVDTFVVGVTDGSVFRSALITVNVANINDAPTSQGVTIEMQEDSSAQGQLAGADVDNANLTYELLSQPSNGILSSFDPNSGSSEYTPLAHFFGTDSFEYLAKDDELSSNTSTVTISVINVNDRPTLAAMNLAIDEDDSAYGTLVGQDLDGDTLIYQIVSNPTNGNVNLDVASGEFTYVPNDNYNGSDAIQVVAVDSSLITSEPALITIVIAPVNDIPLVQRASFSVVRGHFKTGTLIGSDPVENSPLSYHVDAEPTKGTLSLDEATGAYRYDAQANALGADNFTFYLNDGEDNSALATIEIDIQDPANFTPLLGFDSSVSTVTPLDDGTGRVYVGGGFKQYQRQPQGSIVRLNADGSVDSTFDSGTGFSGCSVRKIVKVTDGSGDIFVTLSYSGTYNGVAVGKLVRLNANGLLDDRFSYTSSEYVRDIEPIPGMNKYFIGGDFHVYDFTQVGRKILRIFDVGTLDPTFTADQLASTPDFIGVGGNVLDILPSADGSKVYLALDSNNEDGLYRLNSNGSRDGTFWLNRYGWAASVFRCLAQDPLDSNKIYAFGVSSFGLSNPIERRLLRLNADGSMDASSAETGWAPEYFLQNNNRFITDHVFAKGCQILGAQDGSGKVYAKDYAKVVRFHHNGAPDMSFDMEKLAEDINHMALSSDVQGKMYVASSRGALRINVDGSVDNSFGSLYFNGFDGDIDKVLVADQEAGTVYVAGDFKKYNGITVNHLVRLNFDGSIDTSFNSGDGFYNDTDSIYKTSNGDLLVSARGYNHESSRSYLFRIQPNGSVNISFQNNLPDTSPLRLIGVAKVNGEDKIYVTQWDIATRGWRIRRINDNGTWDSTFNSAERYDYVRSSAIATDGSGAIFVAEKPSDTSVFTIYRLLGDGSLDPNYMPAYFYLGSYLNDLLAAKDGSGKLYVAGQFHGMSGAPGVTANVVRLNADGTHDTSFALDPTVEVDFFGARYLNYVPGNSEDIYIGRFGIDTPYQVNTDGTRVSNPFDGTPHTHVFEAQHGLGLLYLINGDRITRIFPDGTPN